MRADKMPGRVTGTMSRRRVLRAGLAGAVGILLSACGDDGKAPIAPAPAPAAEPTGAPDATVATARLLASKPPPRLLLYAGRSEELVGPLLEQAEAAIGVGIDVRYGSSAGQAAAILEEGAASPADLFISQDAGSIGALQKAGRLADLDPSILEQVESRFRSPAGQWVGLSGRARVFVYNNEAIDAADLPRSVFDLTDPIWQGRVGWAPGNGSFQAFVSAMRHVAGETATVDWLSAMDANDARVFPKNSPIVEATCLGEIDGGLVNHYYLLRRLATEPDLPCANHFFEPGDLGNLINVACAAVVGASANAANAQKLIEFLLSSDAQTYFRNETFEYPLAAGVQPFPGLPPLAEVEGPTLDLGQMDDLEGTLTLLESAGVL